MSKILTKFILLSWMSSLGASQGSIVSFEDMPLEIKFLIFDDMDLDDLGRFALTNKDNQDNIYDYCQNFFLPEHTYENIQETFTKKRKYYNNIKANNMFWRFYEAYLSPHQIYKTIVTFRHSYADDQLLKDVFGFFTDLFTFDVFIEKSILPYRECLMRVSENLRKVAVHENHIFSYCGYGLAFLPPETSFLTNINILLLHDNHLTMLPPQINSFTSLKRLSLYNNKLRALPQEIGDLKTLETLSLSNNKLTSLPQSFGNLENLTALYLNNNQINFLPESFCDLKSLDCLCIYGNPIDEFPFSFGHLKKLRILMIDDSLRTLECIKILEEKNGLIVNNLPIFI